MNTPSALWRAELPISQSPRRPIARADLHGDNRATARAPKPRPNRHLARCVFPPLLRAGGSCVWFRVTSIFSRRRRLAAAEGAVQGNPQLLADPRILPSCKAKVKSHPRSSSSSSLPLPAAAVHSAHSQTASSTNRAAPHGPLACCAVLTIHLFNFAQTSITQRPVGGQAASAAGEREQGQKPAGGNGSAYTRGSARAGGTARFLPCRALVLR